MVRESFPWTVTAGSAIGGKRSELAPGIWLESSEYTLSLTTIMAVDCAATTGALSDFSAFAVLASDGVDLYLLDVVAERLDFVSLCRRAIEMNRRWKRCLVFIERASSGIPLEQQLRAETPLPLLSVTPIGSKVARATAITPHCEAQRVLLPEGAPWIERFLDELCAFPLARYDDQVDAFTLAVNMLNATIARAASVAEYSDRSVLVI